MTRKGGRGGRLLPRLIGLAAMLVTGAAGPAPPLAGLRPALAVPDAREAVTRVAYAEAGNQGDSGLAGVVFTILNRLRSGRWGTTIDAVVNARGQFEPVMRAGGDWHGLRPSSETQRARIETILNLALDGRLPDPTAGAFYFQNPRIVTARAMAGAVPAGLVHFGGAQPNAWIGDHAFYAQMSPKMRSAPAPKLDQGDRAIFFPSSTEMDADKDQGISAPRGARRVFALPDGQLAQDRLP